MKKILFTLLAVALTLPALAQRPLHGTRVETIRHNNHQNATYYGLRLGLGLAAVHSDDTQLDGGSMQAGLNIGVAAGFQLVPTSPVYIEAGLDFVEKGGKGTHDHKKFTYDLNYIELPIVIKYIYDIDGDFSVQPFLGGYLACGVGGKVKDYGERASFSSFDDEYFGRFDGGLRFGCGGQYDVLYAEIAYDLGLTNISNDTFDSAHNGCLYINVGVNF
ncbi:MAG: outer membrane beta-barrel protein [Prevotella sp.]|nr:outer membrane beta-barrel protein [Prevotella sp.]